VKIRICVPLPAKTFSELVPMIYKAEDAGADLIEVRLDYMHNDASNVVGFVDEVEEVIEQSSVPLIATNRQYEQGGFRPQDENQRVQTLVRAAETGFQYVDIELTTAELKQTVQRIKDYGAKPIVSFHDLKCTPIASKMERTMKSQAEAGAEICKLVTTANNISDNIQCMLLTRRMCKIWTVVCFAMGNKGLLSRVLSPLFGAYFTYASLEGGLETASGQISITELKDLYARLGVNE